MFKAQTSTGLVSWEERCCLQLLGAECAEEAEIYLSTRNLWNGFKQSL